MARAKPLKLTYVGGPTAILEANGVRMLTDPTFDPAGGKYNFGLGTGSEKTQPPAIGPDDLGRIDAVLLSHDQHEDNLDAAGRELLPELGTVITTRPGAKRLGGDAVGLAPWESTTVEAGRGKSVTVTATPARHGLPLSRPAVGAVIGFVLEWEGQEDGPVYITGDSVWYRGVAEVGKRFEIGTAIVHLGGVRFPLYGPARFTMNAREAVKVLERLGPERIVPLHFEGWKHFREGREDAEKVFSRAGVEGSVVWPTAGETLKI